MRANALPIGLACLLLAVPALQPAAAATAEDESECSTIATQQTGYDPANPPTVVAAQPAPVTGSGARVRGAAAGATVAAIGDNDRSNGAAKGAAVAARRNQNRRAAADANQAASQQVAASANAYEQARQSCLAGRGN